MRQLTVINAPAIKKFGLWAALLLAFSIPFPLRINSIAVVTFFSLFAILTVTQSGIRKEFITSPAALLIALLFLIVVVGLLHTSDMQQGIRDIERSAFLIALLIIVYQLRNLGIGSFWVMFSFTTACIALTLYGLVATFLNDKQQEILELGHASFPENIHIHPTYLSLYLIFIFYFLLETVRKKRLELNRLSMYGMISILIYVVVLLVFLRSQMSLLIFSMLFIVYIVIIFKRRAWLVTFSLFTIGFLVFLLDSKRVVTFFDTYGKNVSSALDQRFFVWEGAIEGIKSHVFFGAGTGGEQRLISEGYAKTGYQEGIDNSYNAHNQYLQFLARNGAIELLCFLALLVYSFRQSLKMPNYIFLMFNMTVTLIMFTESFLDVQRGIVFFYFFLCVFIYLPYDSPPNRARSV